MAEPDMFEMQETIMSKRHIVGDGTTNGVAYPNYPGATRPPVRRWPSVISGYHLGDEFGFHSRPPDDRSDRVLAETEIKSVLKLLREVAHQ